jgi:hypothetical protein
MKGKITLKTLSGGMVELVMGTHFSAQLREPDGRPAAGFQVATVPNWRVKVKSWEVVVSAKTRTPGTVKLQCDKLDNERWSLIVKVVTPGGGVPSFVAADISPAEVRRLAAAVREPLPLTAEAKRDLDAFNLLD